MSTAARFRAAKAPACPPLPTWEAAVSKWQRERAAREAETKRRESVHLSFAEPWLRGRLLDTIKRADLEALRDAKLDQGAGARTANYLVQTVTAILRAAVRWEWIDRAPKLEAMPEGPPRGAMLTYAQATSLLSALPPHLSRLAEFCLETGLRQGNAKRLQWRQVQLDSNRLSFSAGEMKNGMPLLVPLTDRAREILASCSGDHLRWVFTYAGQPIAQPTNTAWYQAIRRTGLTGVRFHDLRHTWASWHMSGGTDALILQKLGGWKTVAMVARYTHLDDRAAQTAVALFGARRRRTSRSGR
ncbi:MAG: site-specific integrase [Steroidobacteraceae bacterium]